MATRSAIVAEDPATGKWRAIYCHWDGYPSNMLPNLEQYDSIDKVNELISLGHLSEIGKTTASCVAYSRDRGESPITNKPHEGLTPKDAASKIEWEYLYTFKKNEENGQYEWFYRKM